MVWDVGSGRLDLTGASPGRWPGEEIAKVGPHNVRVLQLAKNGLRSIPGAELAKLRNSRSLRQLWLHENALASLPDELWDMQQLEALGLFQNQLRQLPRAVGRLQNLRELSLNGNLLELLPAELFTLTKLEELQLSRNKLTQLDPAIGNLRQLKKLYLNDNSFQSLPAAIATLPITRHGFYATSNPLSGFPPEARASDDAIMAHLRQLASGQPAKAPLGPGAQNLVGWLNALQAPQQAPAAAQGRALPTGQPLAAAPRPPPGDVRQWAEADVVAWVRSRGALAQFAEAFRFTDGAALLALSEGDLERLGVAPFGARHRLLADIAALRPPAPPGPAPSSSSSGPPTLPHGYLYHAFITYRRFEGRNHLAALVKSELDKRGYVVFYDRQSLQGGAFDSAILQALRASCCDIFVLTPGTLDRCKQDRNRSDWVHLEIAEACHLNKAIIPLVDDPQQRFPDANGLPADMANFPRHNAIFWISSMADACVAKLCSWVDAACDRAPPFRSLPPPLSPGGAPDGGEPAPAAAEQEDSRDKKDCRVQ